MRILLYNKATEQKTFIPVYSANIHIEDGMTLYAECECDASWFYKGNLELDDLIKLPYPHPKNAAGQFFRVRSIECDDDIMKIKANHISHDFASAYTLECETTELTLENFISSLTYGSSNMIKNNRGITFTFYQHKVTSQYTTKHNITLSYMTGDQMLNHICTIYGCNAIRDGNSIVLTYGTASDYFREQYELPAYSAILKPNRNVTGMTADLSNESIVSWIVPICKVKGDNDAEVIATGTAVKPTNRGTATDAELKLHCLLKEYQTQLQYDSSATTWAQYLLAVSADITAQAQTELDSLYGTEQNISVEAVTDAAQHLFGGETLICADSRLHKDYSLKVIAFDYNLVSNAFENIQLGRAQYNLADIGKKIRGDY